MPFSERDIQQKLAVLQGQVNRIPPPPDVTNSLTQMNDVGIGGDEGAAPLADGDVLTWVAAAHLWENVAPVAGASENVADASFFSDTQPLITTGSVIPFTLQSSTATQTWLDTSGNITAPGVYQIGYYLTVHTAFTGVSYVQVNGNLFNDFGGQYISSDLLDPSVLHPDLSQSGWQFSEPAPLGAGDVPFAVGGNIVVETDATGVIEVWPFVVRLFG